MFKDLIGKVALITGASRGIGRSIAEEMAKNGVEIIINYKTDESGAMNTLRTIRGTGGIAEVYKCDITSYNDVKKMFQFIIDKFGKIDLLVNNAGISKIGLFMDMREEDYNEVMDSDFRGVFNCTSLAVKYMLERKTGSIINISSIWGNVGASCEVLYSAAKGAVNSFTKALGKELAPSGIRVNAISPGVIDTKMNQCFSKEERNSLESEIPMCRFGETPEIAKTVVFLASEQASYITSQVITVDGGML
ncbi:SDR family oxidoreductase [Clostridium felsineum]|uniref:elongation factor P 5-aminopentanone reductase n=1 Tax=Clostridium felsineum TaxID=36839 RepID=UPI00214D4323|nr:SDR family oxidoreductase [Clostridium felsineum]MCR3759501.1 SDR family oxidoreductase [Clostridium felsineum]